MAVLKGYDSYLGFRTLSTTAEVATVPSEYLYVDDITFSRTKEEEIIPELGIGDRSPRRRVTKNIEATGSFTKSVDTNNGIGLYQSLLGGSLTSASASSATFTHTFSEGDEVPSATRLQFETSLGGNSATTLRWYNGIVESYSLNAAANALAKESWGLKFSNHGSAANTIGSVSLTQESPIVSQDVLVKLGTSITSVSQVATKDITLNINNTLIENRELGSAEVAGFCYDIREINGTFNLTFENLDDYNNFYNETSSAMEIELRSTEITSSTNHYIKIKLPQIHYNGDTPPVGGTGEIIQPISFSAIYGSNAGYMCQIEVLNSASAVTL